MKTVRLDFDQLKDSLREETAIVSVMLANNETGILFPVEEIAEIVKENSDAIFHVDGVNAVGKIPFDLKNTEIDLFSISGHKFHAPKGIGALYIRNGVKIPVNFNRRRTGKRETRRNGSRSSNRGTRRGGRICERFFSDGKNSKFCATDWKTKF